MMDGEPSILAGDAGIGVLHAAVPGASECVVLFNAGAIHRIGPFRLYVALARRLARDGIPVARVDQPGVGDAIARASQPQHVLAQALLDRLQAATGCQRFIVGGICSAADLGWSLALHDPRVVGLVLLDPLARRSHPAFRLGQLALAWRRGLRAWPGILRRGLHHGDGARHVDDSELRDWPAPGREAGDLAQLVARGVEVFALYTGGAASYMTHRWQFLHGFGKAARDPKVRFLHWTDCDHLFYRPADRDRLVAALGAWLRDRFGSRP